MPSGSRWLPAPPPPREDANWPVYGGALGDRYSSLDEINRDNVEGLEEVWRFDAGAGSLQTQPLVVDGVLFAIATNQDVIALDAGTGQLRWRFDAQSSSRQPVRGLAYWSDGADARLLVGADHSLYALHVASGRPIADFGDGGRVDLRRGLGIEREDLAVYLTSPGVIFEDLVITGFRTSESRPAAPGRVRAYDVRTGALAWRFNLIPTADEPGSDTWPAATLPRAGGANAWAGLTVDRARGLVFVPTGSAVDDFYGADRIGDNLYANSLVVLDAGTGAYRWHFQMVHHDILDRDLPSPPALLTVERDGRSRAAVAQATKQGYVFLFDRVTGEPLFPIDEAPMPASEVPGEVAAATQPVPRLPAPFARQALDAAGLSRQSDAIHRDLRERFASMANGGPFMPLAEDRATIVFPGYDGGAEWGGQAVDRETATLYVNSNDVAWTGSLITPATAVSRGESLYRGFCADCHGLDLAGSPPEFPSLVDATARLTRFDLYQVVLGGRGRMPGTPGLASDDVPLLISYLDDPSGADYRSGTAGSAIGLEGLNARAQPAYVFTGYRKFLDADGYPAVAPPWGTLSAIDMNTGTYRWRIPLGFYPALAETGLDATGTENCGGPVVTAGGLVFIGATIFDRRFRAFDKDTGDLLWQTELPYAGNATPITYLHDDRQYVVIAASGGKDRSGPQGSAYVAFALPDG